MEGEETFGFFKEFFEFFELSAKLTEGVPARRRQRAQYIIAMQISRHHPSASLPPSSERRACRCPKFAQSQRLPLRGSCHEVTEGVSPPAGDDANAKDTTRQLSLPPSSERRANCKPTCDDVVGGIMSFVFVTYRQT